MESNECRALENVITQSNQKNAHVISSLLQDLEHVLTRASKFDSTACVPLGREIISLRVCLVKAQPLEAQILYSEIEHIHSSLKLLTTTVDSTVNNILSPSSPTGRTGNARC